jgi:lipopolysaccharide transport system permease protein
MTGIGSTAPRGPAAADVSLDGVVRATTVARAETPRSVIVLQPSSGVPRIDLRELWAHRGLLGFLVWRDIKVRYAQTVLGAGWAILQPVLTMVVFSVIFGRLAKVPSDGVPYPVFSLSALVPWTFFSAALAAASGSLVTSANLITKVYFPRLVIPLAAAFAALMDFAVAMVILLGAILAYGIVPSPWALVVVPLLVLSMLLTAGGVGCWLAAVNLQYRDVKYVVPFLVQVWMFAAPVVYPASLVPERYRWLYALNPMVGVIEGFRATLLRSSSVDWTTIGISLTVGVVLFVGGVLYFRRTEPRFADVA